MPRESTFSMISGDDAALNEFISSRTNKRKRPRGRGLYLERVICNFNVPKTGAIQYSAGDKQYIFSNVQTGSKND